MTTSEESGPIEERVIVACAADERYVVPLAVMLASLSDHIDSARGAIVYVLNGGVSAENRERLERSLLAENVELCWVDIRAAPFSDLPVWGRMSASTYHRLMLPEILPPSVRRLVWLDCDVVVNADVAALWASPLAGRHLLAVQDMIVPYVSSPDGVACFAALGLAPEAKYFNAGVMIVNLDLWRRDDVPDRVADYLRSHQDDVVYWDQEGLNAVLAGRWGELDPRWNHNASVCGRAFYRPRHLDPDAYRRVVEDPWIIHFSGNLKPWSMPPGVDGRHRFFHSLDRTPWAGWRPPRSIRGALLARYEDSALRNLVYPAEAWGLRLQRRWIRPRPSRG